MNAYNRNSILFTHSEATVLFCWGITFGAIIGFIAGAFL